MEAVTDEILAIVRKPRLVVVYAKTVTPSHLNVFKYL